MTFGLKEENQDEKFLSRESWWGPKILISD